MTKVYVMFSVMLFVGVILPTAIAQNPDQPQNATITQDGNNAEIHFNAAVNYSNDGKVDEAIAEYKAAIQLKQNYVPAYTNLLSLLLANGRLQDAETQALQWVSLDPNDEQAHVALGIVYVDTERLDQAKQEFQTAINLAPSDAIAHFHLAFDLSRQDKNDEAINEYRRAIELKPDYALAHGYLGILLYETGHQAEGRLEWQKTLKMNDVAIATQSQHFLDTYPEFQEQYLNPAFHFTAEELNQAIDKGKQFAQQGKKLDDVFKSVAQMPRGVKGEKGKSHESTVYCMTLNATDLTAAAYKAANNYDSLPPHYSHDEYAKNINFFVSLVSVPKVGATVFDSNRLAGVEDVSVTKFVLTDDKGNVINPLVATSAEGIKSGMMNFFGVNSLNHVDTSRTNTNANAYANDSNGNSINAYGTGTRTTTQKWTEYIPWSESHPYFSATYNINFPLFDASGQPLVKTDAKSITLHIITPNGEKQVTYDLHPQKK